MKPTITVAVIVAVLLGGWVWLRQHDADVRATAALHERDAIADALKDSVERVAARFAQQRQRDDDLIDSLRIKAASDSLRADSLHYAEVSRYIELRGAIPKNLQPLLDRLQADHAAQVAALSSVIVGKDSIIRVYERERFSRDTLEGVREKALALMTSQRDGWKQQATKRRWVSCVAGGAWTSSGPGLGVACGVRVL